MKALVFFLLILGLCTFGSAAFAQNSGAQLGDVIGARAVLEDMIVRRLSQELSTRVEKSHFELGAHLDVSKKKEDDNADKKKNPISDLDLGFLDPDALLKSYSAQGTPVEQFLASYLVRKVDISVGLKESLGEEVKKEVEEWVKARVESEFGNLGTTKVQLIKQPIVKEPIPEPSKPPGLLDHLRDFQDLAGQLILGLALVLGALLWGILSRPSKVPATPNANNINVNSQLEHKHDDTVRESRLIEAETKLHNTKIRELTVQVLEVAQKIPGDLESLIKDWGQAGEQGLIKLACFVDIVGKTMGRLPIPKALKKDLARSFAEMPKLELKEKVDALERVYWDLIAIMNLGGESIREPFAFLGAAPTAQVNQVLMENNHKLQVIAATYMSDSARRAYMGNLDFEKKVELLSEAAQLSEVAETEIRTMETSLSPHFVKEIGADNVSLSNSMIKLVDSISVAEGIAILRQLEGPMVDLYKVNQPHLAFLPEWKDDQLKLLLSKSSHEEILAYLGVQEEMVERVLGLVAPMAKQIISDDLPQAGSMRSEDREKYLKSMTSHIARLIDARELELSTVFDSNSNGGGESVDQAA